MARSQIRRCVCADACVRNRNRSRMRSCWRLRKHWRGRMPGKNKLMERKQNNGKHINDLRIIHKKCKSAYLSPSIRSNDKVNTELIQLYWEIGEEIDIKQREQGWGKSVVEILAKELQKEFPGVQGFSARNLWLMRRFFIEYSRNTILHPAGAELPGLNLHPSGAETQRIRIVLSRTVFGAENQTKDDYSESTNSEKYLRIQK